MRKILTSIQSKGAWSLVIGRRFGILSIGLGIVLMTVIDAHLIGLGFWWFGGLLLVGSFLDGGRAAQFLWGFGIAVAVWAYLAGWAVSATEGAGRVAVAALTAVLCSYALVRSRQAPAPRQEALSHTANGHLRAALSSWAVARNQVATGKPLRAGLTYQDGINHLLTCVSLTRSADDRTASSRPEDLMPVYHAMGAMGREGVPVMEQVKATTPVRFHARMTLAAAHLADPVEGRPELIREALAAEASTRLDLNGDGPLSAETRIAGAAQARLLLARLMMERPDLRWEAEPPWLVGTGGPLSFSREKKRFRQAVLPSCAGMSLDEEMRQLAQESVLMFTELSRAVPAYQSDRNRAEEVLRRARVE